jgi:hypothetical protein
MSAKLHIFCLLQVEKLLVRYVIGAQDCLSRQGCGFIVFLLNSALVNLSNRLMATRLAWAYLLVCLSGRTSGNEWYEIQMHVLF